MKKILMILLLLFSFPVLVGGHAALDWEWPGSQTCGGSWECCNPAENPDEQPWTYDRWNGNQPFQSENFEICRGDDVDIEVEQATAQCGNGVSSDNAIPGVYFTFRGIERSTCTGDCKHGACDDGNYKHNNCGMFAHAQGVDAEHCYEFDDNVKTSWRLNNINHDETIPYTWVRGILKCHSTNCKIKNPHVHNGNIDIDVRDPYGLVATDKTNYYRGETMTITVDRRCCSGGGALRVFDKDGVMKQEWSLPAWTSPGLNVFTEHYTIPPDFELGPYEVKYDAGDCTSSTTGLIESEFYDDARITDEDFEDVMGLGVNKGEEFTVIVEVENTGTTTWDPALGYAFAAHANSQMWGTNLEPLTVVVPPGGRTTFVMDMTAPMTDGSHPNYWQMIKLDLGGGGSGITGSAVAEGDWFGEVAGMNASVNPCFEPQVCIIGQCVDGQTQCIPDAQGCAMMNPCPPNHNCNNNVCQAVFPCTSGVCCNLATGLPYAEGDHIECEPGQCYNDTNDEPVPDNSCDGIITPCSVRRIECDGLSSDCNLLADQTVVTGLPDADIDGTPDQCDSEFTDPPTCVIEFSNDGGLNYFSTLVTPFFSEVEMRITNTDTESGILSCPPPNANIDLTPGVDHIVPLGNIEDDTYATCSMTAFLLDGQQPATPTSSCFGSLTVDTTICTDFRPPCGDPEIPENCCPPEQQCINGECVPIHTQCQNTCVACDGVSPCTQAACLAVEFDPGTGIPINPCGFDQASGTCNCEAYPTECYDSCEACNAEWWNPLSTCDAATCNAVGDGEEYSCYHTDPDTCNCCPVGYVLDVEPAPTFKQCCCSDPDGNGLCCEDGEILSGDGACGCCADINEDGQCDETQCSPGPGECCVCDPGPGGSCVKTTDCGSTTQPPDAVIWGQVSGEDPHDRSKLINLSLVSYRLVAKEEWSMWEPGDTVIGPRLTNTLGEYSITQQDVQDIGGTHEHYLVFEKNNYAAHTETLPLTNRNLPITMTLSSECQPDCTSYVEGSGVVCLAGCQGVNYCDFTVYEGQSILATAEQASSACDLLQKGWWADLPGSGGQQVQCCNAELRPKPPAGFELDTGETKSVETITRTAVIQGRPSKMHVTLWE